MNYSSFIVKIIKKPEQRSFKNNISLTELVVQFAQIRKKKSKDTFRISVWGNLANDVMKYYKINDYILIEGYISIRNPIFNDSELNPRKFKNNKQIEVSVLKIYPFNSTNSQISAKML
jgi:single-stranded DNA-binding protein